jgi:hypothetical protein
LYLVIVFLSSDDDVWLDLHDRVLVLSPVIVISIVLIIVVIVIGIVVILRSIRQISRRLQRVKQLG